MLSEANTPRATVLDDPSKQNLLEWRFFLSDNDYDDGDDDDGRDGWSH